MDNLTTHTLQDGREILFVEVPKDACNFIYNRFPINEDNLWFYHNEGCIPLHNKAPVKLPQGNWRIIGVSDQLTTIQQEEYRSLGLDTTKRYVLIEKLK